MGGVKDMKYYKLGDQIFAYEDTQLDLVTDEMVEITGKDLEKLLNPDPLPVQLKPLTNRQFKLALLNAELIDSVEAKINTIEDPVLKRRIQIEYEYATAFERNSESIAMMIELLGISSSEVDQMWISALSI